MTAPRGIRTLGKYTFVTRFTFETMLALALVSDDVKYCIGSSPERTRTGVLEVSRWELGELPKMTM